MTTKFKEEDIAGAIVEWLACQHWDVYQEVTYFGSVADIVAVQGPVVWVIECKRVLGLDVIAQAGAWVRYAHLVSIGVMAPLKHRRADAFVTSILRSYRIGLLQTSPNYEGGLSVDDTIDPQVNRPRHHLKPALREVLQEEHKHFAKAGNADGARWTPFRRTCLEVLNKVTENPGIKFKDLIKAIDHHYASDGSAKASLRHWIERGVVRGVKSTLDGRSLRVWPTESNK